MADSGLRIGVYVCHCGSNIAGVIDPKEVAEFASHLPGVVYATNNHYACSDPGQKAIASDIQTQRLNRVVVAACSARLHEATFRRAVAEAGLNPYFFEMANIREQNTWVHAHEAELATAKAKDQVAVAVAKAAQLRSLEPMVVPVTKRALVVGGGVAGLSAALDLADMGFKTYIVEREPTIGGRMAQLNKTFPTLDCSI
jgi:heterodisulfide reductase subunit A2